MTAITASNRFLRGDLLIFVSYVPDGDGYRENGMDSKQPALCLARHRAGRQLGAVWVIPLSEAWRYCNADGFPTTYAYKRTEDIGNFIGMGDTVQARRQIWQAIGDYLPELMRAADFEMVKDARHGPGRAVGEVALMNDGVVIGGAEILH